MNTYRQGEGLVKTFRGTAPTYRAPDVNGVIKPLPPGEIAGYVMFAQHEGDSVIENIDITLVNGAFSEPLNVDLVSPGMWKYWFRTVDTIGQESINSEVLTLEVLAPLANPNPPTGIGIA
jgi:hypothetical protein